MDESEYNNLLRYLTKTEYNEKLTAKYLYRSVRKMHENKIL